MSDTDQLLNELLRDVQQYAEAHNGRIYAPICHPSFRHIPYQHGPERYEALAPHIPKEARTALDIGSHWGYFAHRLEDHGLQVTAAENSPAYLKFLRRIRDLCGKKFEIFDRSVFELPDPVAFDVVLALNIFHHFTKTKAAHDQLVEFLGRLDARVIFFQAHNPKEGQMAGAYLNLEPDEFAAFVSNAAGLSTVRRIGGFGKRPMYQIS